MIQALCEKFSDYNLVLCLPYYDITLEKDLQERNIPHYYNNVITDFDGFNGFLSLNVTDIFIGETLGFYLPFLHKKAKKKNIALRTFCNVCQTSWADTESIKTFFIRPDDIDTYANYIDVFEFFNADKLNINTLYEIYSKNKFWYGELKEIIIGYKGEEDSRFIIPTFGEKRTQCKKRCCYEVEQHTCYICDAIVELSKSLKENNLIVQKVKPKEKKDESQ